MAAAAVDYIVNPEGAWVDPDTGLVLDDHPLDLGPEWRSFAEEERLERSRAGAPLDAMLHDYGVASYIYGGGRLSALQARLRQRGSERLVAILRELWRLCSRHMLPGHVCGDAARVARRLAERRVDPLDAAEAALYAAALQNGVPAWRLELDRDRARLERLLARSGVRVSPPYERLVGAEVARLAEALGLPPRVASLAMRLYRAYGGRLQGSRSASVAAALVYIAAKLHDASVTQSDVAKKAGVTTATILNNMKKMGLRIVYRVVTRLLVYEETWWPWKDTVGVRRPAEIAAIYIGRASYDTRISLDEAKVTVEIVEQTLEADSSAGAVRALGVL